MINGSLKRLITRYNNGNNNSYKDGKWSLAVGGYDLWFELYYNNIPVIQCIDGYLEVCNDNMDIDYDKSISTIKELLTYIK
ncbi:hypothetical protein [Clostridium sp. ZBS18]|uniref:hypothetical protein n=1 Tax=Clostridium sp. ZBS18 TaxID=2949967 RepID=UPI0020795A52|nr:hypothetical protein [Clostridium sp. ZBS18]